MRLFAAARTWMTSVAIVGGVFASSGAIAGMAYALEQLEQWQWSRAR